VTCGRLFVHSLLAAVLCGAGRLSPAVAAPAGGPPAGDAAFPAGREAELWGFLRSHCVKCHADGADNGIRLDNLPVRFAAVEDVERWQKVLGVLNAGEMPPEEEPTPPAAAKTEFLALLSETLVSARRAMADQGRIAVLRRLNRREYALTLRSLTGLDIDVSGIPDDSGSGGFDTFGSSLFLSSDQFEQYLSVGRKTAAAAIDHWKRSAEPAPASTTVRTEVEILARRQMAGLLNGYFLGGYRKAKEWEAAGADAAKVKDFGFPDEQEARFRIRAYEQHGPYLGQYLALPKSDEGAWLTHYAGNFHHTETITIPADAAPGRYLLRLRVGGNDKVAVSRRFLEMGIVSGDDFRRLGVFQVTAPLGAAQVLEVPVRITSDGARAFSFREKRHADPAAPSFQNALARAVNGVGLDCALWIDWVEWEGPLPDAAAADACLALFGSVFPADPDAAATRGFLEHVATRAFRGVRPEAPYLDRLMAVYEGQRAAGRPFAEALVEPIAVVLASPTFLYLHDPSAPAGPEGAGPVTFDRPLSDLEIASRLSYFFWAAPPDEPLLAAAASGGLRTPEGLASQGRRLLADPRSFELARGFTHQWLDLDRLDFFRFDHQLYPEFDEATREAAKAEVYQTFHLLARENLDARKLLASDFVVVNGLLASYYGLEDRSDPEKPRPIRGDAFRKVALPADSPRGGLLGMAAVLGMGSNGERTSPVERGAWVLRKLLDDPPPPAPPNVPQLSRLDGGKLSARERLRAHQEEPQCAQCHRVIDPIGIGLENFDAAGRWRTEDHLYRMNFLMKNGPHGKVIDVSFPIQPAGAFHDGPAFEDYFELRAAVAARGDAFVGGLVRELYTYALGRPASFADNEWIEGIVARACAEGGRLGTILLAIVQAPEFRTK
jgi:hypothetical protein